MIENQVTMASNLSPICPESEMNPIKAQPKATIVERSSGIILEDINKLKRDTQAFLETSTSLNPSHVNVLSLSKDKIIIEVTLNGSGFLKMAPNIREHENPRESGAEEKEEEEKEMAGRDGLTDSQPKDKKKTRSFSTQNPTKSTNNVRKKRSESETYSSDLSDHGLNRNQGMRGNRSLRRTISENIDFADESRPARGILKYPRNWRRTVSESNCGTTLIYCTDTENSCLDLTSTGCEGDSNCEPKKSVHFNEFVAKTTFRANSSILGRKKKNQRRALRRYQAVDGQSHKPTDSDETSKHSGSDNGADPLDAMSIEKENSAQEEASVSTILRDVSQYVRMVRLDSGYDSEENSGRKEVKEKWSQVKSKRNKRKKNPTGYDHLDEDTPSDADKKQAPQGQGPALIDPVH